MAADQNKLQPPSARAVAQRALILASLACRGHIEQGAGDPGAEETRTRLTEWLQELELWEKMDPFEKRLLESPLGTLVARDRFTSGWRAEGLLVVAWALDLADLLPHDTKADPFALTDSLYSLHEDAREIVEDATLRAPDELGICREYYYAVHVRLREFLRTPAAKDCRHHFEPGWHHRLGLPDPLVKEDLAIHGLQGSRRRFRAGWFC